MKYLVNGQQMRAIDNYSINEIKIPSMILMEKAAMACARVILETAEKSDKILAVCGFGNNGGDGIATARILKEAGLDVSVLLVGREEKASEQTRQQLEIGHNLNLPIFYYKKSFNEDTIKEYNIVIDALFGIGLSKPITGEFEEIIEKINQMSHKVYAVDIPSGVDSTNGQILGVAVKADVTITFGLLKWGLGFYPGAQYAGKIIVADIGFPKKAVESVPLEVFTYEASDIARLPKRTAYSNKGTYGRVLVIGGAKNMAGAVCLAARSAYRVGAGLVKVLTCEENRTIVQTVIPEALLSTYESGHISEEWLQKELDYATAIVLGPGLSMNEDAKCIVETVLTKSVVPVVIDADALNLIAKYNLYESIAACDNLILTPHLKEMSRLAGCEVTDITKDMMAFAKRSMKDRHFTLVLKDARTLVLNEDKVYMNLSGNNGMAVGGSGDVLSGMIGGMLAQKMKPFEAAALAVYLHGCCGDQAAEEKSEYAMIAGDLIDSLAKVINRIEGKDSDRK